MLEFEIDLLLRINLMALTDPDEEIDIESVNYLFQVQKYEEAYRFPRYYLRNPWYRYVRLADIADDLTSYIQYCLDLDEVGKFYCCQLQQAFGILSDDNIVVLMTTDSGVCYNLLANYDVAFETVFMGETNYMQPNTFYGKAIDQDTVQMAYHPSTGNLDPHDPENIVYTFSKSEIEALLKATIEPISKAFIYLNHGLSKRLDNQKSLAMLNEVFPLDVRDKVDEILDRYRSTK